MIQEESKNKAKIVGQGYSQEEGTNLYEIYAIVVRLEANMMFLTYACNLEIILFQTYVESCF